MHIEMTETVLQPLAAPDQAAVSAAFSDLEFMRPLNRRNLAEGVAAGGASRSAVHEAVKMYMLHWSRLSWVDNTVSLVGFWIAKDTPEEFSAVFEETALQKTLSGDEGERRAWNELLLGMREASRGLRGR
jgi:hypothetical protein